MSHLGQSRGELYMKSNKKLISVKLEEISPTAIEATNIRDESESAHKKRENKFNQLIASIESNSLQYPIIVRELEPEELKKINDGTKKYGIIEGHQRYKAYTVLQQKSSVVYATIPALLRDKEDEKKEGKVALIANAIKINMTHDELVDIVFKLYYDGNSLRDLEKELGYGKSTIARLLEEGKQLKEGIEKNITSNTVEKIQEVETVLAIDDDKKELLFKKEFSNITEREATVNALREMKKSIMKRLKDIQSTKIEKPKKIAKTKKAK